MAPIPHGSGKSHGIKTQEICFVSKIETILKKNCVLEVKKMHWGSIFHPPSPPYTGTRACWGFFGPKLWNSLLQICQARKQTNFLRRKNKSGSEPIYPQYPQNAKGAFSWPGWSLNMAGNVICVIM
jgi:hypothetical protein